MINHVILKGNLAQLPYFDMIPGDGGPRPFMRFYLAVDRPSADGAKTGTDFFRVVAYEDLAMFSYPYLQPGSEVLVVGRLRARKRNLPDGKRQTVVEVVATDITFLRKIDWETGDAARERILRLRSGQALQLRSEQPHSTSSRHALRLRSEQALPIRSGETPDDQIEEGAP
jgi:single-stranded DNA-binding protein